MTEQPIAPVVAAAAPAAAPPATEPDWKAIAEKANADLDAWKGHARHWENTSKANKAAADAAAQREAEFAKALGLDAPDPAKLAAELADTRAQAQQYARENAVLLAAGLEGANAAQLLDSRSFAKQLEGIDPADTAAVRAAVKSAVEADARFAAAQAAQAQPPAPVTPPAPRASAAGSMGGSPGGARQLTAADVAGMTGAQLSAANKQGLLNDYFATPNQ